MARSSDDLPIKQIIENLFKDKKLGNKYLDTKIPVIWESAVGKYISERTIKLFAKNQILYVYLSSAPLKQEMMHNKEKIIQLVNEKLEAEHIKSIEIR